MNYWKSNISKQTEAQKFHNGKRLLMNYILNDEVELSFFRNDFRNPFDEIYVDFGVLSGVCYIERGQALATFHRITIAIQKEYNRNHGAPSRDFIYQFIKKFEIVNIEDSPFNTEQLELLLFPIDYLSQIK